MDTQRQPSSQRVAEIFSRALAVWTVLCHSAVLAGFSLRPLVIASIVALLLTAFVVGWKRWHRSPDPEDPEARGNTLEDGAENRDRAMPRGWRWASLAIPLGLVGLTALGVSLWIVWALAVVYLGTALTLELRRGRRHQAVAVVSRVQEAAVWFLASAIALTVLAFHRPNLDDVFYISMAVHSADHPDQPLLSSDTLHGLDLPLLHEGYRFHVLEVLAGSLAFLTGIGSVYWLQWVFTSLAAMIAVFAGAYLCRLLVPKRWLACLAVMFFVMVAASDGPGWYGALIFERLHQGKSVFLAVFVPLVTAYGIAYARRPTKRRWRRLAISQIAASGTTATALWSTPLIAGLALLVGTSLQPSRRGVRTVLAGSTASFYPALIAMGLFLTVRLATPDLAVPGTLQEAKPEVQALEVPAPTESSFVFASARPSTDETTEPPHGFAFAFEPPTDVAFATQRTVLSAKRPGILSELALKSDDPWLRMSKAYEYVMGRWNLAWFGGLAFLLTWRLVPEPLARRFALIVPLSFLLFLFNPFLAIPISRMVMGAGTYWRIFWLLPLPLFIALWITWPTIRWRPVWRHGVVLVLMVIFVLALPRRLLIRGSQKYISLTPIRLNLPHHHGVARELAALVPAGSTVLAPRMISDWLPTIEQHPNPLMVRTYLRRFEETIRPKEVMRRRLLTDMITGRHVGEIGALRRAIDDYKLAAVCYPTGMRWKRDPTRTLFSLGFHKVPSANPRFVFWIYDFDAALRRARHRADQAQERANKLRRRASGKANDTSRGDATGARDPEVSEPQVEDGAAEENPPVDDAPSTVDAPPTVAPVTTVAR